MYTYFDKEFDDIEVINDYNNYKTNILLLINGEYLPSTYILHLDGLVFVDSPKELYLLKINNHIKYEPIFFIYDVETNDSGYDTYDGFVVIAESESDVRKRITNANVGKVTKIGRSYENKERVVLASFNAG